MFQLYADKVKLAVRRREPVTSGSVDVYPVHFAFSDDWADLTKTAIFKAGAASCSVLLDGTGQCAVPWEVLTVPGRQLSAGVCGVRDGRVVLPTVWANLGAVLEGALPSETARPPTPGLYEQILKQLSDLREQVAGADRPGIATDEESAEMLNEVFGTPEEPSDAIATDEEISEMLNEVFHDSAVQNLTLVSK